MTDIKQQAAEYLALADTATPAAWLYKAWPGDSEYSVCLHDPAEFRDPAISCVRPLFPASDNAADIIRALLAENEALRLALYEAMGWNWLDEDVPPNVVVMCESALSFNEAAKERQS